MTDHEQGPPDEHGGSTEEVGAEAARSEADDQAHRTAPPSNPEPDREAVEKAEENIGRVTGR